jgi:protocatechuate 3,4-dioxygenase beta subunit
MKRIRISLVSFAILSATALIAGQRGAQTPPALTTGTGALEGVVRRSDTRSPIEGVTVSVFDGRSQATVITDTTGRFRFANLAPANYALTARRDGYAIPLARLDDVRSNTARTTAIVNDQKTTQTFLELLPGGRISGRVYDAKGQPLANVQVAPFIEAYPDGRRTLVVPSGFTRVLTDDRGEFRMWGLVPGQYYVRAEYRAVNAQIANGRGDSLVGTTYFPNAAQPANAQAVTVRADSETPADIHLLPVSAVKISGRISADPSVALSGVVFTLTSREDTDVAETAGRAAARGRGTPTDGQFELIASYPGLYDLFAEASTPGGTRYVGRVSVDVRDRDIANLSVPMLPTFEVKLHIGGDRGALPTGAPSLQPIAPMPQSLRPRRVIATAEERAAGPATAGETFAGVVEGQYHVNFTIQRAADVYVADIRQGQKSIYEDGTIVVSKDAPLQVDVTLARPGGVIQGVVRDSTGKPVESAEIRLIPEGRRRENPLFYREGTSDAEGRFSIQGAAPGSYKLFAWSSIPRGIERSARFMAPFEQIGKAIDVTASSSQDTVLTLILTR